MQSQSVSRGSLFHGISAVSALCGFFLKRRMAAYFSSFRMNLQRMPSRHETTYPHSSQIVYLRLWGYASPFTIYGAITGQVSFIFQRFPHSWKRQRGYAHWQGQGPVLFLQKSTAGFHDDAGTARFNHGFHGLYTDTGHVKAMVLGRFGRLCDNGPLPRLPPRLMQASVPSMASTAIMAMSLTTTV